MFCENALRLAVFSQSSEKLWFHWLLNTLNCWLFLVWLSAVKKNLQNLRQLSDTSLNLNPGVLDAHLCLFVMVVLFYSLHHLQWIKVSKSDQSKCLFQLDSWHVCFFFSLPFICLDEGSGSLNQRLIAFFSPNSETDFDVALLKIWLRLYFWRV